MNNKDTLKFLRSIGACEDAQAWVKSHGGTFAQAWQDCERGDWMAWLLVKAQDQLGITRQQIIPALCDCAELSLKYFEEKYPNDNRPRKAIETARQWAKGLASEKDLRAAAAAADAAAAAAYAAADADAAYAADADAYAAAYAAAAAAAAAAYAAAYAADAAADAAAAAADAAADAAYAAAKKQTLKKCADIIRKHFPVVKLEKISEHHAQKTVQV